MGVFLTSEGGSALRRPFSRATPHYSIAVASTCFFLKLKVVYRRKVISQQVGKKERRRTLPKTRDEIVEDDKISRGTNFHEMILSSSPLRGQQCSLLLMTLCHGISSFYSAFWVKFLVLIFPQLEHVRCLSSRICHLPASQRSQVQADKRLFFFVCLFCARPTHTRLSNSVLLSCGHLWPFLRHTPDRVTSSGA